MRAGLAKQPTGRPAGREPPGLRRLPRRVRPPAWLAIGLLLFLVGVGTWCAVHAHDANLDPVHRSAGASVCVFYGPVAAVPETILIARELVATPLAILPDSFRPPLRTTAVFHPPKA